MLLYIEFSIFTKCLCNYIIFRLIISLINPIIKIYKLKHEIISYTNTTKCHNITLGIILLNQIDM